MDLPAPWSRRPRTAQAIRVLVLEMAQDDPGWVYRRIAGDRWCRPHRMAMDTGRNLRQQLLT